MIWFVFLTVVNVLQLKPPLNNEDRQSRQRLEESDRPRPLTSLSPVLTLKVPTESAPGQVLSLVSDRHGPGPKAKGLRFTSLRFP